MKRSIIISLVLFWAAIAAKQVFAENSIFLYPEISSPPEELHLSDIARIEGDLLFREHAAALPLPHAMSADGIIDRGEIRSFIKQELNTIPRIYGGGVRLRDKTRKDSIYRSDVPLVKMGSIVTYVLRRGGIIVRVTGTALKDGQKGDTIPVKINSSKKLFGRIAGPNTVEATR